MPNRTNIVITRDVSCRSRGIIVVHSLDEALQKAKEVENEEVFIIGGGQIYQAALPFTDKLYLTLVEGAFEADTFFPEYARFKNVVFEEKKEEKGQKLVFLELIK